MSALAEPDVRTLDRRSGYDQMRSFAVAHFGEILRDSWINARRPLPFAVAPTFELEWRHLLTWATCRGLSGIPD
jgi:hypothetical protein